MVLFPIIERRKVFMESDLAGCGAEDLVELSVGQRLDRRIPFVLFISQLYWIWCRYEFMGYDGYIRSDDGMRYCWMIELW